MPHIRVTERKQEATTWTAPNGQSTTVTTWMAGGSWEADVVYAHLRDNCLVWREVGDPETFERMVPVDRLWAVHIDKTIPPAPPAVHENKAVDPRATEDLRLPTEGISGW